jgi:hypothetical protein
LNIGSKVGRYRSYVGVAVVEALAVVATSTGCVGVADPSTAVLVSNACPTPIEVTILEASAPPDAAMALEAGVDEIAPGKSLELGTAPGEHSEYLVLMNTDQSVAWTRQIAIPSAAPWPEVTVEGPDCPS